MKKFARLQNLFFDYEEEKRKKVQDEKLNLGSKHFFSSRIYSASKKSNFSKQVVIKLLSNLSAKGVKNALSYVIRNSESDFALNQYNERVLLVDIMKDWNKDFSHKPNAKEAWHFSFCLDESVNEKNLKLLQQSVNEVMQKNFYEYKYVSVVHSHQNKPHIHIILNKNNIFTRKKLHFKSNQELKDFWNLLREDFKNSLNFHNPHLNYTNKYKFERDLTKENALNKIQTPLNINQEIAKSMQVSYNKIELYERKIEQINKKISALSKEKIALLSLVKELMAKKDKRYFQKLKAIKSLNKEILDLKHSYSKYKQDIALLRKQTKELNYERLSYKNEYDSLAKKQAYLQFLESKVSRFGYSKGDVYLLDRIKSDLAMNAKSITQSFEQNIKTDIFLSRTLNKKSNAFSMINLAKDLEYHLRAISKIDISSELSERLQNYTKTLESNKAFVLDLCEQKAQMLNEISLKGKKSPYKQKELEALSVFLNKPQSSVLQTQSVDSSPIALKESNQAQKVSQAKPLENLNIDDFLKWYCKKQDIRNIAFYEASLKEKIKKNTFENFKQLYKEFEYDKSKGVSR
ncbi:relaxase [Helicobacter fennelliae]|uniref:Relaxase n=2 Tax=Helicobacter fennelliae TaxID=215 RepID=A0A2X3EF88_9HELI|nr:relaxase [Helicobacter fennelliae]